MKRNILFGMIALLIGIIGIVAVMVDENTLVFHPKGVVAHGELRLIIINTLLMLSIIIPTYILLFVVVWKYCLKQGKPKKHDPEHSFGTVGEMLMWGLPTIVVIVMAIYTWEATHRLNPYKPLESDIPPLRVHVVAMDWKWLFIYPEQGIATLNYLQIPEKTPVHFTLAADHSPMNSFWIPQLGGQIYSMAGMSTQLHLMADGIGKYAGRAVEINGEGYADMTFEVRSTSEKDFVAWILDAKKSSHHLTSDYYKELVKPAVNKSVILFSEVEDNLYHKIVDKYMYPAQPVL